MKAENSPTEKKKIIIDLDVVTVALWDSGNIADKARDFLNEIKHKKLPIITPTSLIQLVKKWRHEPLKNKILSFYVENSIEMPERIEILEEILLKKINFEVMFQEFLDAKIKEEDINLILMASVKKARLVTFNKVHLRNKVLKINEILSKYGLNNIRISSPEERGQ